MERNILIDDIDTLSYRLQSHENSEDGYPYALGIYVNNGTPLEVYNTLRVRYRKLIVFIYVEKSSNRYIHLNGTQRRLPYYELYKFGEKIAESANIEYLHPRELKDFLDPRID